MGDNQLGEVSLEIFSIYNSKTEEDLQKPNIEKKLVKSIRDSKRWTNSDIFSLFILFKQYFVRLFIEHTFVCIYLCIIIYKSKFEIII